MTDSDNGIPTETVAAKSSKVVMSRIEVADLIKPTTQMAPLFAEGTGDETLSIEEHVPLVSGEHAIIPQRDSRQFPLVDLRMSGMVPIDDRSSGPAVDAIDEDKRATGDTTAPLALTQDEVDAINAIAAVNEAALATIVVDDGLREAAPVPIEDAATNDTVRSKPPSNAPTSLGVAPLEPATTVKAPFVNDTPVPARSPLPRPVSEPQAQPITTAQVELPERERTAMVPLDRQSGMQRSGPWQALVAVAKSLRSVRWWRRRNTARIKRVD